MSQAFLAVDSPYTLVWHDGAGQAIPSNTDQLQVSVTENGLGLSVRDNSKVREPIILIYSAANNNRARTNIHLGSHAEVQIIEYLMADDEQSTNDIDTTITCSEGAQLKHCVIQQARNQSSAEQHSVTTINQATNSNVDSNIFSFGGKLSNIELKIALQGVNAACQASCLAFTNATEQQKVRLQVDHMAEYCTSKSLARGVLKDKSNTEFIGRINVHPGAKKTVADLQIRNLICSDKALAVNKPELEIYNDDVRCSHGSSTGQLDQEALFYIRSRGLDEQTAIAMLLAGFIQPAINSCTIPLIADYIQQLIAER